MATIWPSVADSSRGEIAGRAAVSRHFSIAFTFNVDEITLSSALLSIIGVRHVPITDI